MITILECKNCLKIPQKIKSEKKKFRKVKSLKLIWKQNKKTNYDTLRKKIYLCTDCYTCYYDFYLADHEDDFITGPSYTDFFVRYPLFRLLLASKHLKLQEVLHYYESNQPSIIKHFIKCLALSPEQIPDTVHEYIIVSVTDYFLEQNDWKGLYKTFLQNKNLLIRLQSIHDLILIYGETYFKGIFPYFQYYRDITEEVQIMGRTSLRKKKIISVLGKMLKNSNKALLKDILKLVDTANFYGFPVDDVLPEFLQYLNNPKISNELTIYLIERDININKAFKALLELLKSNQPSILKNILLIIKDYLKKNKNKALKFSEKLINSNLEKNKTVQEIIRYARTANRNRKKKKYISLYMKKKFHDAYVRGDLEKMKFYLKKGITQSQALNRYAGATYTAIKENDLELLKLTLKEKSLLNKSRSYERSFTPIGNAILHNNFEAVKLLIEAGINPERPNSNNQTPLMQATDLNLSDIVKLLLDKGVQINKKHTYSKMTALMIACQNGYKNIVKLLLDFIKKQGCSIDIKDRDGKTAFYYARNKPEILKLLENF